MNVKMLRTGMNISCVLKNVLEIWPFYSPGPRGVQNPKSKSKIIENPGTYRVNMEIWYFILKPEKVT